MPLESLFGNHGGFNEPEKNLNQREYTPASLGDFGAQPEANPGKPTGRTLAQLTPSQGPAAPAEEPAPQAPTSGK